MNDADWEFVEEVEGRNESSFWSFYQETQGELEYMVEMIGKELKCNEKDSLRLLDIMLNDPGFLRERSNLRKERR